MTVHVAADGPVRVVTLDRPDQRNAVDRATATRLADAIRAIDADPDARVGILTGAGGTFCAGADLKAIAEGAPNRLAADGDAPMGPSRMVTRIPWIAAIEGHAVAGGLELAVWCDLRVMASDAILGVFCRRWGVPLIDGGTVRLPRLIGESRALDLILTGRPVDATEAFAIGLANRVCEPGDALATAKALARDIASFPQACLRADRASARAAFDGDLSDALAREFDGALVALRDETRDGAARFARVAGRGGRFDDDGGDGGDASRDAQRPHVAPRPGRSYRVASSAPAALHLRGPSLIPPNDMSIRGRLEAIASNLWWCWNPHAQALFSRIDFTAWERTNHSPLAVLRTASEEQLAAAYASDEALDALDAVQADLHRYLAGEGTWVRREAPGLRRGLVAYFCAEFGIHESLPLYSGGLGVLAGDHIKTASDVGVPFIGIGLKYPEGYFQQSVDADGWQQERYPPTDWSTIPAERVSHGGEPLIVDMPIADRTVYAQVWKLEVGRATLYLLDTNVPQNNAEDRSIGGRLYSGGSETRIRQEIVLGVGGVRLLRALKLDASVYHLNEGHSAFACLELMREHVDAGLSFDEALSRVQAKTLFTTHTPVPAGHDRFAPDLVQVMLWRLQQGLKVDWRTFLGMGRVNLDNPHETFCMTVLALKCASKANGVSALHGEVSREMWRDMWPGWAVHDVPIDHVTNGIHVETFMHPSLRETLDAHFAGQWQDALHDDDGWAALIDSLSDDDIIQLKRALKKEMFASLKQRLYTFGDDYGPDTEWQMGALANWQTDVLTIGFARRFATYKRGAMLFDEFERAVALIADTDRPIQIVYAGKAHPKDVPGKEVIQRVIRAARDPRLKGRVLFMENYDMSIARSMVSGVDVWLNTPRRPREASGTSGQKVNMHGGVNCSILDGWWGEGFDDRNGFAIGDREVPHDPADQDRRDREALYGVLEGHVVPEYYAGTPAGSGDAWVARMRGSMRSLPARFSTRRMLADYIRKFYAPITAG